MRYYKYMIIFLRESSIDMSYHNGNFVLKNKSAFEMVNECFSECSTKILPNKCKNINTKRKKSCKKPIRVNLISHFLNYSVYTRKKMCLYSQQEIRKNDHAHTNCFYYEAITLVLGI